MVRKGSMGSKTEIVASQKVEGDTYASSAVMGS